MTTTSPSNTLPKLKRQHTKCLDRVIIGWDDIEAVLMGCMSVNLNIILLGKHGLGKTHTGKLISEAFEKGSFRYYDCSKADMIALAGIPDPEALKNGRFDFAKHEQTIWDATVVLADEINRAPKSMQNLWLEVANDNALCGKPLRMKCLIATMNPENYTGTVKLDDALADRFACVVEIPIPGNSERIGAEVIEVLSANLSSTVEEDRATAVTRIGEVMRDIRELYKFLICDDRVFTTISRYVSTVLSIVCSSENKKKAETDVYISRRRYKLIAESILAVSAYYKIYGKPDWMIRGALDVLKYAIAENPTVQVPWERVKQAHTKAQKALQSIQSNLGMSEDEALILEYNQYTSTDKKMAFLRRNADAVLHWTQAEQQKVFSQLLTKIRTDEPASLTSFIGMLTLYPGSDSIRNEARGILISKLAFWSSKTFSPEIAGPLAHLNITNPSMSDVCDKAIVIADSMMEILEGRNRSRVEEAAVYKND